MYEYNYMVLEDGSVYLENCSLGPEALLGNKKVSEATSQFETIVDQRSLAQGTMKRFGETKNRIKDLQEINYYLPPSQYFCASEGALDGDEDQDGRYDPPDSSNLRSYCYPRVLQDRTYEFFDREAQKYSNGSRLWMLIGNNDLKMLGNVEENDNSKTNRYSEGINPNKVLTLQEFPEQRVRQLMLGTSGDGMIEYARLREQAAAFSKRLTPEGTSLAISTPYIEENIHSLTFDFMFTADQSAASSSSRPYWNMEKRQGMWVLTTPSDVQLDFFMFYPQSMEGLQEFNARLDEWYQKNPSNKKPLFSRMDGIKSSQVESKGEKFNVYWSDIYGLGRWIISIVPNGLPVEKLKFTLQIEYVGRPINGISYGTETQSWVTGKF